MRLLTRRRGENQRAEGGEQNEEGRGLRTQDSGLRGGRGKAEDGSQRERLRRGSRFTVCGLRLDCGSQKAIEGVIF